MKNKAAVALVGGTALGVAGFVGLRLYIRSEVEKTLISDYAYDKQLSKNLATALVASQYNLPTASELATSLVPIWSTTGPHAAIEDVLRQRRKSAYWPEHRRTSKAPAWVDTAVFNILLAMYEKNK
jgi:hypothetical protein